MAKDPLTGSTQFLLGYRVGSLKRPHLRVIVFIAVAAFLTTLYILATLSTSGYISLIRHLEDIDPDSKSALFEYLNVSLDVEKTGYLVYSPSCRIPDTPPFHESIRPLYEKLKPLVCSSLPLLTSVSRSNGSHVLRLHRQYFSRYVKGSKPSCCYNLITREDLAEKAKSSKPDDVFKYSKCEVFDRDVVFRGSEQFVRVLCEARKGKKMTNVYTNMHAFVGISPKIAQKMKRNAADPSPPVSVMIVGIDSISRLNLLRVMPQTASYLNDNGWYNLKGYNKMDDNTFPNLMAILAGMTTEQIQHRCWPNYETALDNCPLIWKNFSTAGSVTAYAEDEPVISSFNYVKKGFRQSPTDFYLRPFMLAADKSTKLRKVSGMSICLGPSAAADHILDYSLDFASTFQNVSSFSLFWMNTFSHNGLNVPSMMDDRVVSYLKSLTASGALNTTIVMFLSDHGMRFGKIRETYIGYIEERLPFIYIWLPEQFRAENPVKVDNLVKNTHRLTSPFDLHLTLVELLGGAQKNVTALGCPKCLSLFEEVPWNRSCSDAGITNHWCTCAEYKTLSTEDAPVRVIAKFVVDQINVVLQNYKRFLANGTQCATLRAKRVLSIRSKIFSQASGHQEFVVLVQTVPGDALFEATVSHDNVFRIVDSISRINSYERQSRCISNSFAKKYCFCQTNVEVEEARTGLPKRTNHTVTSS